MPGLTAERLHAYLPQLISISLEAGLAIMDVYGSEFAVELKDDRSPLTLADRRSHDVIVKGLATLEDSPLPVLSEEGRTLPFSERNAWKLFWLVDPLDGTKEFVKRNGEFTVNIALISGGRPVLGIIYVPVQDICFFGAEGIGSYRLDNCRSETSFSWEHILAAAVKLPCETHSGTPDSPSSRITVIGSRSHMSPETEQYLAGLKERYAEVDFISAGSSLKFCLIAEGRAQIYPRFGPTMEWDTAAGQAIVEQAGGEVVEAGSGKPLLYNKESLLNPYFIVQGRNG